MRRPGAAPPLRCYALCAVPRSGSNLLVRALAATGLAGLPAEVFNPAYEPYASRRHLALERYARHLVRTRSTPNGVFGFKIFFYQLEEAWSGRDPRSIFPGLRFLSLRRRDHLRQAVSFARAIQTRRWESTHRAMAEPRYDGAMIERRLRAIEREERGWDDVFARLAIEPLEIVYEDFVASYEATLHRVLRAVGIPLPAGFRAPPPPIARQADALNEAWAARYRREQRS